MDVRNVRRVTEPDAAPPCTEAMRALPRRRYAVAEGRSSLDRRRSSRAAICTRSGEAAMLPEVKLTKR